MKEHVHIFGGRNMMIRIGKISILFTFMMLATLASGSNTTLSDNHENIEKNLQRIKSLLKSREWSPADTTFERQLIALVNYFEHPQVDSVVSTLDSIIEAKEILFVRDRQRIKNPENVKGYVQHHEISEKLVKIADEVEGLYPPESIIVPEDRFAGGYAMLNIIGENETERMLHDSIFIMPDSILSLLHDPLIEQDEARRCYLDSLSNQLINEARLAHNKAVIQAYRDSVTENYRDNFIQNIIKKEQTIFLDSVYTINNQILAKYNDNETLELNQELKGIINDLLWQIKIQPNQLTILNLNNEPTTLNLQNFAVWHQWVWLKNTRNDSIGIRVENIDKHSLRILVDESINLSRLTVKSGVEIEQVKALEENDIKLSKIITRNPELSPWKLKGKAYAGFTQNYINEFWSQGGKSSASALATFNYSANYEKKKLKWENFVDMKVGVIYYLPEEGSTVKRNWHKNSDNIELNSRLGYSAAKKWYYSTEANFKTQLFYGYSNQKDSIVSSALFSPAYLTFSAGMEYKPKKNFSMFLSPVSLRTTFVTNPIVNEKGFGLNEGETRKSSIGFSAKIDYSQNLMENISFKSKNSMFINYGNNASGELQLFKLPDFDSENSIEFKVNQFITTQVNFHFIYDKDVESRWTTASGEEKKGTRLQIKEFFTLGFSYKF